MLRLSRRLQQCVVIDLSQWGLGLATVSVEKLGNGKVGLGFDVDDRVPVHRAEFYAAKIAKPESDDET